MFRSYSYTDSIIRTQQESSKPITNAFEGYSCDLCPPKSNRFVSQIDVDLHRKKMHFIEVVKCMVENKERFCTICMTLRRSYCELITHIKTDHLHSSPAAKRIERDIYICNDCHNLFFNKEILEIHVAFWHNLTTEERNKKTFSCPKCRKNFPLKSVWFHFQFHEIPSVTVCDICITSFPTKEELKEHLKSHPMLYQCNSCRYITYKKVHFDHHLKQHEERIVNNVPYVGKVIKRVFRRKIKAGSVKYNIHHVLKGLNVPKVIDICTLCREICTDRVDMRNHVLRDHLYQERQVTLVHMCYCGMEFSSKVLLKQHVLKMQGSHRVLDEGEFPACVESELSTEQELTDQELTEQELTEPMEEEQRIYIIETEDGNYEASQAVVETATDRQTEEQTDKQDFICYEFE